MDSWFCWFKLNRNVHESPNGIGINAYGEMIVGDNQFIIDYTKHYSISGVHLDAYDTRLAENSVPAPV